ncbi:UNVERIFIED_CONTAM: hypothetical protein PYX00_009513 [Menopon gallinae]|uniref:Thioredoxin domain-containing protein n=1 Tax=Menopon gallinae TaxID=328185 RepID=A0AAW2HBL1_9NEOP
MMRFIRSIASSAVVRRKPRDIVNNDEFIKHVINSEYPVVVNFHADWCDPCKILTPKLKEIIEPMGDVDLAIVDVEKNPELVESFEVKAVPAVVALRNGHVVDKFIGLVDEEIIGKLMVKLMPRKSSDQKS